MKKPGFLYVDASGRLNYQKADGSSYQNITGFFTARPDEKDPMRIGVLYEKYRESQVG